MLAYIHWNADPTMFRLGPFELFGATVGPLAPRWYGLLFALGFLVGFWLMRRVFLREGKPEQDLDALLLYLLGGTIIGSRLGHVLFYNPGYYLLHPGEIIQIWEGGLASHGGLIGVLTAIWLYTRNRTGQSYLWLLDRLAAPVALTGCFIRLGNLFNSEILGVPTDVPWAFVFEKVDMVPRHPAQLYESLCYLLIFVVLQALYERLGALVPRGMLFGGFLVLIFGSRFFVEFVKMRQAAFAEGLPLSMGQLLSIPVVLVGFWLLVRAWRRSSRLGIGSSG
jgi:prolipoprotein diacylglyceryl transferase